MRIKPWTVTGAVAVSSAVALGIIIAANDPGATDTPLRVLFWTALVLGLWGTLATAMLLCRMNLAQATWLALAQAVAGIGILLLWRGGFHDRQLLGGLILTTLLVSFALWWRLRHAR